MTKPELHIVHDPPALARRAAAEFVRIAEEAVRERGRFTVALSGGSTPRRLYELLADEADEFRTSVPWRETRFYFGDERHLMPDHADSNYRMAREAMFACLPASDVHVERMLTESPNAASVAADYERRIRVGVRADEEIPRFDLVLLGLGTDGHTASLFPETPALAEDARLVVANPVAKLGTDRLTFTYPLINRAAHVMFLVAGSDKADTLRTVLAESESDDTTFPASRVRPHDGKLTWLIDEAAAGSLPRRGLSDGT